MYPTCTFKRGETPGSDTNVMINSNRKMLLARNSS